MVGHFVDIVRNVYNHCLNFFSYKGKCGCRYFILLTLKKKNRGHRGPEFFNKKIFLDYYFCLKSGPVFLFQISS